MADEKETEKNEEAAVPAVENTESTDAAPEVVVEAEAKPAKDAAKPASKQAVKAEGAEPAKEDAAKKVDPRKKDIFLEIDGGEEEKPKVLKAKGSKNVHSGIVHVLATFNNTKVSVTDRNGNVIGWSSSGKLGFKGSRKSTAYAAQMVSQDACRQAMGHGLKEAEVRVKGPGSGRESAVRAVQALGIDITVIQDVTPIPHNGCRPPKARRV